MDTEIENQNLKFHPKEMRGPSMCLEMLGDFPKMSKVSNCYFVFFYEPHNSYFVFLIKNENCSFFIFIFIIYYTCRSLTRVAYVGRAGRRVGGHVGGEHTDGRRRCRAQGSSNET